jgi:hypothetical protein
MGRKAKQSSHIFLTLSLAAVLLAAGVWHFVQLSRADITETVTVSATVVGCGDGVIQLGEDCDGSNMNGHTCVTEGYVSGSISCQPNCTLNTSSCSNNAPSNGGGSNPPVSVSSTNEIFNGYAYPGSPVTMLKDGQPAGGTTADSIGEFQFRVNNLSNGTYSFAFFATDEDGNQSALTTVPITATGGTVTTNNIFLSPTIQPVTVALVPGDTLTLAGESAPGADVALTVFWPSGAPQDTYHAVADANGMYSTAVPTNTFLTEGNYTVTATATLRTLTSTRSLPMTFAVGSAPVPYMPGDYNENRRVNLVDFSIALYWYKEPLSDAFKVLEIRHGNGDGLLNLIDISIIAYWWTG